MNKLLTALAAVVMAAPSPRPPSGAGHYYPAKAKDLEALVSKELKAADDGTALPAGAKIVAILVPHAGLEFSGLTAARAFRHLKKGDFDAVIVLGTAHYKVFEGAALYEGEYAAGMPYDAALGKALMAASPLIKADAAAHKKEHSVENQIPFLRRVLGPVPTVALLMNSQDLDAARQVAKAVVKASAGKRVLLVASSDMSHYPEGTVADAVDATTLLALETLEPAYFWLTNRFLENRKLPHLSVTYCGEAAVTAVAAAARQLGAKRLRVLGHINSGDVVSEREYNHVVGYASALFTTEAPGTPLALSAADKAALKAAARSGKTGLPLAASPRLNLPGAVFVTGAKGRSGAVDPQESLLEAAARAGAAAGGDQVAVVSGVRTVAELSSGDSAALDLDGKEAALLSDAWKTHKSKESFLDALCAALPMPAGCWRDPKARLRRFSVEAF